MDIKTAISVVLNNLCMNDGGCYVECEICEEARQVLEDYNNSAAWTSVEERMPERREYLHIDKCGEEPQRRLEVAYITDDNIEYQIGYYDGYKWMDSRHNKIDGVMTWKIHVPYNLEKCPKCGKMVKRLLALSREDNKTRVCDVCGTKEALDAYEKGRSFFRDIRS